MKRLASIVGALIAALVPIPTLAAQAEREATPVGSKGVESKGKVEPTKHPFLWRIEGKPPSFLYGTIHLADRRVTELPPIVEEALDACDVLLTEIEFAAGAEARAASMLPKGQKLSTVLPKPVYARLAAYLESKRYPIAGVEGMQPWVVMTMLPLLDDLKAMLSGMALDVKLVQEAKARDKATGALESLQEQLGVFAAFDAGEQAQMLDGTLGMLEDAAKAGRKPIAEMVQAYLGGDLAELERLLDEMSGLEKLAELKARLEKLILVDRNHRMVGRLVEKLRAEPKKSYFAAVGALHYPGKDGLLELLRAEGFTITRVGGDPLPAPKPLPVEAGKVEAGKK